MKIKMNIQNKADTRRMVVKVVVLISVSVSYVSSAYRSLSWLMQGEEMSLCEYQEGQPGTEARKVQQAKTQQKSRSPPVEKGKYAKLMT